MFDFKTTCERKTWNWSLSLSEGHINDVLSLNNVWLMHHLCWSFNCSTSRQNNQLFSKVFNKQNECSSCGRMEINHSRRNMLEVTGPFTATQDDSCVPLMMLCSLGIKAEATCQHNQRHRLQKCLDLHNVRRRVTMKHDCVGSKHGLPQRASCS